MVVRTKGTALVQFQVNCEKQRVLITLVTEIKAARHVANHQLTHETGT